MTIRQKPTKCPQCGYTYESISNYFHALFAGHAHRGSSFMDVDTCWLSHDRLTARFLFMEFKHACEPATGAQQEVLEALSRLPGVTCWYLQRRANAQILWAEYRNGATKILEIVPEAECQARYRQWWDEPGEAPHFDARFPPEPPKPQRDTKSAAPRV